MVTTRQWQLAHQPRDEPKLDGPDATFKLVDVELPELQDGDLLIKTTDLSNDPAQRGWIDPDLAESGRLYVPPVKVGTVMSARGLAEVIESKSPNFKKGDYVVASAGWAEQAVVKASAVQPAKDLPGGLPKTHYLGALGGTGLTAWAGLYKVAEAKKDDIVCISGAAGATGSVAVQIAKNIIGCKKVIGIAGTDDKCRYVLKRGIVDYFAG
jgi:NADPH-dependent curcumin reductase CurA